MLPGTHVADPLVTVPPGLAEGVLMIFRCLLHDTDPIGRLWIAVTRFLFHVDVDSLGGLGHVDPRPVLDRVRLQPSGNSERHVRGARKADRRSRDRHAVLRGGDSRKMGRSHSQSTLGNRKVAFRDGKSLRAAMRITGGHWAGRTLVVPTGQGVRPTPDKVRQAIFNSLGDWVRSQKVLELFAGSGALSLECLSREAATAFCV